MFVSFYLLPSTKEPSCLFAPKMDLMGTWSGSLMCSIKTSFGCLVMNWTSPWLWAQGTEPPNPILACSRSFFWHKKYILQGEDKIIISLHLHSNSCGQTRCPELTSHS